MFRLGDRVVLIKTLGNSYLRKGDTGVVVDYYDYHNVGVDWGKCVGGHSCNYKCEYGNGWYVPSDSLKIAEYPRGTSNYDKLAGF